MTPSEAMKIMENPSDYTVQERKDAKVVLRKYSDTTAADTVKPGIGMRPRKQAKPKGMADRKASKTQMMRGGMANGKQHMYAAGGMVNDGLKALKASGPKGMKAYNKIMGN